MLLYEWIRKREAEERQAIWRERREEMAAVYLLAEMHTNAGQNGRYTEPESDLRMEAFLAFNGMVTIGTTTYAKAADLLGSGYPELSMDLLRLVLENWIAAEYVQLRPQKARAWIYGILKNAPGFAQMREVYAVAYGGQRAAELNELLRMHYDTLSRYAHVSPMHWHGSQQPHPESGLWARLGPRWEPGITDLALYTAFDIGLGLLKTLSRHGAPDDTNWPEACVKVEAKVNECMAGLKERTANNMPKAE